MRLDLDALRRAFREHCALLRSDPRALLPSWTNDLAPGELLRRPLVCVGADRAVVTNAIDFLRRAGRLVGIVNDTRVGSDFAGFRCISTREVVAWHRRDPSLVLVNSCVGEKARRHFQRVGAQSGLPVLSVLELYRLLRVVDGMKELPLRSLGLLELGDPLAFLDGALACEEELCALEPKLADTYSRLTLYGILLERLTGQPSWLALIDVQGHLQPYAPDSYIFNARYIQLGDRETYVDAGAYRGETIDIFERAVKGRFRRIHAFEPHPVNAAWVNALLLERFGARQERAVLHRAGLWERAGRLRFVTCDSDGRQAVGSHFDVASAAPERSTGAAEEVPVVALDEALAGEPVSFLKLEVEGSEVQALRGARRLIGEHRPKMALSVYHRARDLIDVVAFVESLDAGYSMGLAQHAECPTATVLYATAPP
jgi:FkbM family methyltransferase